MLPTPTRAMPRPLQSLLFLGATAFPELVEVVRDLNAREERYAVAGILDDNAALHGTRVEGVPVLGPLELVHDHPDAQCVLGIGSHRTRLVRYEVVRRLGLPAERWATLVHPLAKVYSSATVGHGCVVYPGAVVFCGSVLEDLAIVLANSVIGYENRVCEGALVTSLVACTTHVKIGHYAHVGTRTCIGERVAIGPGAQVAMGSTVLRDVPPGAFSFGDPPRLLGKTPVPEELLERWARVTGRVGAEAEAGA